MAETVLSLYPYVIGGAILIWTWRYLKGLFNR